VLDRLVRRAVLAQPDRVVREHEDDALLHQRGHAQRVARVVGKHQEGADERQEAAVQRHAVGDRAHAELAHAVVDVAAVARSAFGRSAAALLHLVRLLPVRSAEPPSISGSAGASASSASCDALRVATASRLPAAPAIAASSVDR
jgi:hypothetical protein